MAIVRMFRDEYGIYCIKIETDRGDVYCITKAYPYSQRASFPRRVARRAADNNTPLAIFFGEDEPRLGDAYVFSSEQVLAEGEKNIGASSQPKRRVWLDIPLDCGVIFGDYVTGRADV